MPIDNDELRDQYQSRGFGTCGPAIIAVLFNETVQKVIDNWYGKYEGYCTFHELKRELERYDWNSTMVKSNNKRAFMISKGVDKAICLIGWKRKYSKWDIPAKNTHFILLQNTDKSVRIFCNSVGWVNSEHPRMKDHLKKGKVQAYLLHKHDIE